MTRDTSNSWTHTHRRRFMIGLHLPDYDQVPEAAAEGYTRILAEMDPKRMVRSLRAAHVQMFYFYAKCHYGNAYYPTAVERGHPHSALKGRDLFGELTQACLDEGIIPGGVYEVSDHRVARDHQDWCHRSVLDTDRGNVDVTDDIQGTKIAGGCINGPYGDYILEQTREVMETYPIRCWYVDFLGLFGSFTSWVCPWCHRTFEAEFGMPFPGTARLNHEQLVRYRHWRYEQYDRFTKKLIATIRDIRPDMVFTHNFFGITEQPGQTRWRLAAENCDFLSKDVFSLRNGTLPISLRLRALGECSRKAPAEVLLDTMISVSSDWYTPKPFDAYRAEIWTARCAGLSLCGSILPTLEGSVHTAAAPVLALAKKVYAEQKLYEPWLEDMVPCAEVALLRSRQTIENRPCEETESGLCHARDVFGWCETLISSQRLWTVIQDHHVTDADLERFRVLVLPNVSCLDDEQCGAIERFVQRGGRVIADGETSLFDAEGRPQRDLALARLFGVNRVGDRNDTFKMLRITGKDLKPRGPWAVENLFFNEGQWPVAAASDAEVLGIVRRQPFSTMTRAIMDTDHPGLVRNRVGKGVVWYAAGLPGYQYQRYGQHTVKHLMRGLLDAALGGRSPVTVNGSETLELFAHTRGGCDGLIVSLVNNVSSVTRTVGMPKEGRKHDAVDVMPVLAEAELILRPPSGKTIRRVRRLPQQDVIRLKRSGRNVSVRLSNLGVISMLAVEYGPTTARGKK